MKNEERAQAYREVADWLLEHGDIEPQVQVRLSKMVRDYADELDPPGPDPGTVVWWSYANDRGRLHLGYAIETGVVPLRRMGLDRQYFADLPLIRDDYFLPWDEIEYKPARIAGPAQEIVNIPPVREWPRGATAIYLSYVDMDRRFTCSIASTGRIITRDEAARMEADNE